MRFSPTTEAPARALAAALLLAAVTAAVSACETPPEACGEYDPAGGPAVIRTRDQELCEVTRQRVMQYLQGLESLDYATSERLFERSQRWRFETTVAGLLETIRADAGEDFADAVRRAIESVQSSRRPLSGACESDRERCLAQGAAKGAYLALSQRSSLVRGLRPKTDTAPAGARGGIDVEDLAD